MRKKYYIFSIIALISLCLWIHNISNIETNNYLRILNLETNRYLKGVLLEPDKANCNHKLLVIIIVTSYIGHVELRSEHRKAMPQKYLDSLNATRIFLLARQPPNDRSITQELIIEESNTFGDILQGEFIENYRNLTYKHLMGLNWAGKHCKNASYILKVDDDIVFNLEKTNKMLSELHNTDDLLLGYMLNETKPRRDEQNKWYVTQDEYPYEYYPPYLSGWYYITTSSTAIKICQEAEYHPYFWIDDILITGILRDILNIKLRSLPKHYWLEYYELLECCIKDMTVKFIKCDHVIGPNGGRNNLIGVFNEALRNCGNCTLRPVNKPLEKFCIASRTREIFSAGKSEVKSIVI